MYVFKRGGPNELMDHVNKVHKKDSIGDEYSRLLPLPCQYDCGYRFKNLATQKTIDSHCESALSDLGILTQLQQKMEAKIV